MSIVSVIEERRPQGLPPFFIFTIRTMKSIIIYLDESGDLGWVLDKPYRQGGSSKFLTISAVIAGRDQKQYISRGIKELYEKYNWDPKRETKWSYMDDSQRVEFSKKAKHIAQLHSGIKYLSITAYKPNVQDHIRKDPNKLYNYMINLLLLEEISKHDDVVFIPDPRSIKVSSGNSLHDYIQTQLWFEKKVQTKLTTCPQESASTKGVQFADMISGLVQQHFEDRNSEPFHTLNSLLVAKKLYFS